MDFASDTKPTRLSEFVGNTDDVVAALDTVLANKAAVVVAGPPGCGKTSLCTTRMQERGLEELHVDADSAKDLKHILNTFVYVKTIE